MSRKSGYRFSEKDMRQRKNGGRRTSKKRDSSSGRDPQLLRSLARIIDRRRDPARRLLLAAFLVAKIGLAQRRDHHDLLSIDRFEMPDLARRPEHALALAGGVQAMFMRLVSSGLGACNSFADCTVQYCS